MNRISCVIVGAAVLWGLAACGSSSSSSSSSTPSGGSVPPALQTLFTAIGDAHTFQDLLPYIDPQFLDAGYTKATRFTRSPTSFTGTPVPLGAPGPSATAIGTYNPTPTTGAPVEHLYSFTLASSTTVSVTLNPYPLVTSSLSPGLTQGAGIYSATTGTYYVDLNSGTYQSVGGGTTYVLTLPADTYLIAVSDCATGCFLPTGAQFTVGVTNANSLQPNLLYPGFVTASEQYMPKSGTTNEDYIAFSYLAASFSTTPVEITAGPLDYPVVRQNGAGAFMFYGNQLPLQTTVTVFNDLEPSFGSSSTGVSVEVQGAGVTGGTVTVSNGLNFGSPTSLTGVLSNIGFAGYYSAFSNFAMLFAAAGTYTGTVAVAMNIPATFSVANQTVNLPGTLPSTAGTITLSCTGSATACTGDTATMTWTGWETPTLGSQIMSYNFGTLVSAADATFVNSALVENFLINSSGTLSATLPDVVAFMQGSRTQDLQSGDNVIMEINKFVFWTSGATCPGTVSLPAPCQPVTLSAPAHGLFGPGPGRRTRQMRGF